MEQNFKFGNLTDVGLVRKANEDYYGCFNTANGHVFVVCDGMGGHVGGAVASQTAVEAIKTFYDTPHANIFVALQTALVKANEAILEKIKEAPELDGMGTTCVLLVIKEGKVYYAHIGDSRIYYIHRNQLKHITKDHSFVQSLVDEGHITEEEAEMHPNKNQITKALGIHPTIEPTICEEPIIPQSDDYFLLASDGLTGMTNDDSILEAIIEPEKALQEKVIRLIELAKEGGGKDNITAQLIHFIDENNSAENKRQTSAAITQVNPQPFKSNLETTKPFHSDDNTANAKKTSGKIVPILGVVVLLGVMIAGYSIFGNKSSNPVVSDVSTEKIQEKENTPLPVENSIESIVTDSTSMAPTMVHFGEEKKTIKPTSEKKKIDSSNKIQTAKGSAPTASSSNDAKMKSPELKASGKNDSFEYTIQKGDSISVLEKKFKKSWTKLKSEDQSYSSENPEPGKTIKIKTLYFFNYNNSQQKLEKITDALKKFNIKESDLIFLNDLHVVLIPH